MTPGQSGPTHELRAGFATALGLALLAILQCLPVLLSGDRWGFWDWDISLAAIEAARVTVAEYGQDPGWYPYVRGGESLDAHPLLPLASPSFLVILGLGTIRGVKLWIVVRQFLALLGGYLLARRLGFGRAAALTVGVVFGLSSTFPQRIAHGHWNLQACVYLPWVVAAGLAAMRPGAWRGRILAAGWLALMLLDGDPYAYVAGCLALAPIAVIGSAQGHSRAALASVFLIVALSLALGAVKAVPVYSAYGHGERATRDRVPDEDARSLAGFAFSAWLDREQSSRPGRYGPFHINSGAYVGPLGMALVALAPWIGGTVGRVAVLFALPYLWLVLDSLAPLNLWAYVHELPVFDSMRIPAKFTPCYLLAFAIAAGATLEGVRRYFGDSWLTRLGTAVVVSALGLDLVLVSRPLLAQAFPIAPIEVKRGDFYQLAASPYLEEIQARAEFPHAWRPNRARSAVVHSLTADLPAVLANQGFVGGYLVQPRPLKVAVEPDPGPGGPGAVHSSPRRGVEPRRVFWSPNEIRFEVDPTRGGVLVVNQNYHRNWLARGADQAMRVTSIESKLAIELEPGIGHVTVSYRSPSRRLGAWVSGVTWIGCGLVLLASRWCRANGR